LALTPGARLGVYEIIARIGEGGMGQVYRARDTRLDRDVAIKILPEAFAHDVDRLARFQREAKTRRGRGSLSADRIVGGGEDTAQARQYDVAPDGRFLINTELESVTAPITLLMNWNPEGKK
jgi:serine/threonine protein kinase